MLRSTGADRVLLLQNTLFPIVPHITKNVATPWLCISSSSPPLSGVGLVVKPLHATGRLAAPNPLPLPPLRGWFPPIP